MFRSIDFLKKKNRNDFGFLVYEKVEEIPDLWDYIAGNNYFLKREFLKVMEDINPCNQKYHININENIIFVEYKLYIDIFTFKKGLSLKIPINIIGIPASVSSRVYGYLGDKRIILSNYIKSTMKISILLNSEDDLNLIKGRTLSDFELKIRWNSFQNYLDSMRSHYRYRAMKGLKRFDKINVNALNDNNEFSQRLYSLYLQVYERSQSKLEKLSIDYFKKLPGKILVFKDDDREVGFVQLKEVDKKLYFLFCGFDESLNKKYDLYLNMIFSIIDYSIINGFDTLSLGQTTEDTKLKVGSLEIEKYLYFSSKYKPVNLIGRVLVNTLSYRKKQKSYKVFRA